MKTFLLFAVALSLVSCGGGGGYTVTEQSSDCPLCKAAKEGDLDQVEIFLSGGMNPNSVSSSANAFPEQTEKFGILNDSALRFAVVAGHADIVRVLLDAGADVNKTNKRGATPLFTSGVSSGEVTKILLDAGANPNAADKDGFIALRVAVWKGNAEIAKVLLDGGANPNTMNKDGVTALADTVFTGNAEIAKMLLDRGANPNTADKGGWTPINIAANKGQVEVAKVLLDCGASPDIRNDEGTNAWDWVKEQPVMQVIFNRYLAEVKAGKVIKSCPHEEVAVAVKHEEVTVAVKLPKDENAEAQYNQGWIHYNGDGVSVDKREALRWFRLAAEQGYVEAQYNLGWMYNNGEGVATDKREAFRWYQLAAEQRYAEAQFSLGWMYKNGAGVATDKREAFRWYQLAAEQRYAEAQYNLGWMYNNGEGVVTDKREAARWFRMAAEQGYASAQNNLGVMYYHGNGVVKDEREAYIWFLIAKAGGSEDADASLLKNIWQKYLTSTDIQSAKREAVQRFQEIENSVQFLNNNSARKSGEEFFIAAPPKEINIAAAVFENAWRSVVMIKGDAVQGSGVIIRPNLVATNCHVVEGGGIFVYKPENRWVNENSPFSAKIVYRKKEHDFCILEVNGLRGFPAKIRKYDTLKIGENVYALGAPKGLDLSLSSGIISQLRQEDRDRIIQTDAAISPGSSGGGLFDSDGNLVGITTAVHSDEDAENIGFAIPADLALEF